MQKSAYWIIVILVFSIFREQALAGQARLLIMNESCELSLVAPLDVSLLDEGMPDLSAATVSKLLQPLWPDNYRKSLDLIATWNPQLTSAARECARLPIFKFSECMVQVLETAGLLTRRNRQSLQPLFTAMNESIVSRAQSLEQHRRLRPVSLDFFSMHDREYLTPQKLAALLIGRWPADPSERKKLLLNAIGKHIPFYFLPDLGGLSFSASEEELSNEVAEFFRSRKLLVSLKNKSIFIPLFTALNELLIEFQKKIEAQVATLAEQKERKPIDVELINTGAELDPEFLVQLLEPLWPNSVSERYDVIASTFTRRAFLDLARSNATDFVRGLRILGMLRIENRPALIQFIQALNSTI